MFGAVSCAEQPTLSIVNVHYYVVYYNLHTQIKGPVAMLGPGYLPSKGERLSMRNTNIAKKVMLNV
jgi:hypothetical protein